MTIDIGILQGRLSPSLDGRFQFFPVEWEKEFSLTAELGFSSIEWLVDWPDWATNPILDPRGEEKIRRTVKATGISVNSLCGDYFMKYRLTTGTEAEESEAMAVRLVEAAAKITRQKLLLIPLLEQNAYPTGEERTEVAAHLKPAVHTAEKLGVRIGFETEMTAQDLTHWLDRFGSAAVGVYYDIGNSTSYGFDCPSDLRHLGNRIFGVHIKDRKVGSSQSVPLGTGDADLAGCLTALIDIGFEGIPILQGWHGNDFLRDAKNQLRLLQRLSEEKGKYENQRVQESL